MNKKEILALKIEKLRLLINSNQNSQELEMFQNKHPEIEDPLYKKMKEIKQNEKDETTEEKLDL